MTKESNISWNDFKTDEYLKTNYVGIHEEDQAIIRHLSTFLTTQNKQFDTAIDVGAGPNLYPALLLQPFVRSLRLFEYGSSNVSYLQGQLKRLDASWQEFITYIKDLSPIYDFDIESSFYKKTSAVQGNIFELPTGIYELATMFFCAESITNEVKTFEEACRKYAECVVSGGTLIAAFMENSQGYEVGNKEFPAVPITEEDLMRNFSKYADDISIERIPVGEAAFREGYSGMLLLTANRL